MVFWFKTAASVNCNVKWEIVDPILHWNMHSLFIRVSFAVLHVTVAAQAVSQNWSHHTVRYSAQFLKYSQLKTSQTEITDVNIICVSCPVPVWCKMSSDNRKSNDFPGCRVEFIVDRFLSLTYAMEQRPWEADSSSASQEITCLFWIHKVITMFDVLDVRGSVHHGINYMEITNKMQLFTII